MSSDNNSITRTKLTDQILDVVNKKSHFLILSFSGNGCGYFLEYILTKNKINFRFIDLSDSSPTLNNVNIVTIHPDSLLDDLQKIDNLFLLASANQKFIVVSEYPNLLLNQSYTKLKFSKHIYKYFYLPTLDTTETKQMIVNLNPNLVNQETQIYTLTGGISRLVKQYCIDSLSITNQILEPIFNSINHCPQNILKLLNLTDSNGNYLSNLLNDYIKTHTQQSINIQINLDLTVTEDNQKNSNIFVKTETDILSYLLTNQIANRDQIATIKWGHLADEKYSDEAINKTISRLNSKLNFYLIQSIPKLGYKLTKK